MAAADRLDTYAPDLEVGGVIGFGASGEVDVLFRNFPFTVPWAVWSYGVAWCRTQRLSQNTSVFGALAAAPTVRVGLFTAAPNMAFPFMVIVSSDFGFWRSSIIDAAACLTLRRRCARVN